MLNVDEDEGVNVEKEAAVLYESELPVRGRREKRSSPPAYEEADDVEDMGRCRWS